MNQMNSFSTKAASSHEGAMRKDHHSDTQSISDENSINRRVTEDEEEMMKKIPKFCCNCKKSRCLKLYCDCFAVGKCCTKDCNCINCLNTEDHE